MGDSKSLVLSLMQGKGSKKFLSSSESTTSTTMANFADIPSPQAISCKFTSISKDRTLLELLLQCHGYSLIFHWTDTLQLNPQLFFGQTCV